MKTLYLKLKIASAIFLVAGAVCFFRGANICLYLFMFWLSYLMIISSIIMKSNQDE